MAAGVAGCLGDDGDAESDIGDGADADGPIGSVDLLTPEGNLNIIHFLSGTDEGLWNDEGVDFNPEVAAYGRFVNALPTGANEVGLLEYNNLSQYVSAGEDLVQFGPCLTQINSIFVPTDSDIETVEDLQGVRFGHPGWATGTGTYTQAIIAEQYGFDIREANEDVDSDPATLWDLMVEQDEVDAMLQFTGQTVRGLANPDEVRPVFNAWEAWEEQTGYPPLITPWCATRSWLENNYDVALALVEGWAAAQSHVESNAESVVEQYGQLAGVAFEDREAVVDLAASGDLHLPVDEYDDELIDSQWQLIEAMEELGSVEAVPPREDHVISIDALREEAES
ncbi:ABC transporter substrate-binding protein [Halorubrum sp. DTA98]|uniref:ABC transporter substrate-binding protein n=1 Tax=Halorubrum sp. DTA98 TaxID=3402163 RepID=UPI003AAFDD71